MTNNNSIETFNKILNTTYIINYNILLISISVVLAIFSILDYHCRWTKNSNILLVIYYLNWIVLVLNITYLINIYKF
jgi:hypothetical protein